MLSTPVPLFSMLGSPLQLLVIGLILLLLFGAGRLGDFGKGLGEGIKNFKKGLAGDDDANAAAKKQKPLDALPTQTQDKDRAQTPEPDDAKPAASSRPDQS